MIRAPFALRAYALAARAATPMAGMLLDWRARRGKEDRERRGERLGLSSLPRPDGPLAWLHGASVGETLSLLPLIEKFRARNINVLVTSGTVTSAAMMLRRLPPGAQHQYLPLDSPVFAKRFIKHWRPDLALFAESDIWPNLIAEAKRNDVALMLVNARMSERSYQRWRRMPAIGAALIGHIDLVLAQSDADAFRFGSLGAQQVATSGNLKFDGPPPPADAMKLAALSAAVAGRPVWLAASTHQGEDEIVIAAHKLVAERLPDILTIIAPRHPDRGESIAALAAEEGLRATLRSKGGLPPRDANIYIADTLGEMGLFYRLSPVALVAGSLTPIGGHNPIEAAKLSVAILHGPHIHNAADVYAALDRDGGARLTPDADTIAREIVTLITEAGALRLMGTRAFVTVDAMAGAAGRIFRAIEPWLARLQPDRR